MSMLVQVLLVAVGGALGSVARHLVNVASLRWAGLSVPFGTLTVNLVGAFVMGLFVEVLGRRLGGSPELRLFVATGILGGFTTFSSFALDTAVLYERGDLGLAFVYVAVTLVVGLAAIFAGLALGRIVA